MERPEEQTPIYKKAKEIQKLILSLVTLIEESDLPDARDVDLDLLEDDLFNMKALTSEIITNVLIASSANYPYDLRMECAVLIKKASVSILTYAYNIEDMGLKDIDYLDLIYEEIEAFRLLFIDWIKTFELWKYDEEDWGLFNPEGIQIIPSPFDDDDDDDEFYDYDDDDDDDDTDYDSDHIKDEYEALFKNINFDIFEDEGGRENEIEDEVEDEDEDAGEDENEVENEIVDEDEDEDEGEDEDGDKNKGKK